MDKTNCISSDIEEELDSLILDEDQLQHIIEAVIWTPHGSSESSSDEDSDETCSDKEIYREKNLLPYKTTKSAILEVDLSSDEKNDDTHENNLLLYETTKSTILEVNLSSESDIQEINEIGISSNNSSFLCEAEPLNKEKEITTFTIPEKKISLDKDKYTNETSDNEMVDESQSSTEPQENIKQIMRVLKHKMIENDGANIDVFRKPVFLQSSVKRKKVKVWSRKKFETDTDTDTDADYNVLRKRRIYRKRKTSDDDSDIPQKKKEFNIPKGAEQKDRNVVQSIETFGEYRCSVCNIAVNSEVTMQTHLLGRKHHKALKAMHIPETAIKSYSAFSDMQYGGESVPTAPPHHYPRPAPGMKHIKIKRLAKLQGIVDNYHRYLVPGLSHLIEIHSSKETVYYCDVCDSPCSVNSVLCHLTGFKHLLNCLKRMYPALYDKIKYKQKKEIEGKVVRVLLDHEKVHGREIIQVVKEVEENTRHKDYQRGSNDRREYRRSSTISKNDHSDDINLQYVQDLDLTKSIYHCNVCDSHMNNESMWEAHIRGKRHLANKKKFPGENPSKIKTIYCPGERAHLMDDLKDIYEPVVGLDYIRETQRKAGDQYNCFICGACCTNFDIVDHILSEKHRKRYLETVNKNGTIPNDIETFKEWIGLSNSSIDTLIAAECRKIQNSYGRGRVDVHKSKDIYPGF